MMYCPQCGALSEGSANWCTVCGAQLRAQAKRGDATASGEDEFARPDVAPGTPAPHQAVAVQPDPFSPLGERVFRYHVFERSAALTLLSFVGYLAIAAGWVAFVYLAIPEIWELATEGVIPYSQSKQASYEGYLAWGIAGLLLLMGFVVIPLVRVFGIREVAFTEPGIAFRGSKGETKLVMSHVTDAIRRSRLTKLQGKDPQGRRVRQVVPRNRLGKERYREFQETLEGFLRAGGRDPGSRGG